MLVNMLFCHIMGNKGAKMALNRSFDFEGVNVLSVCVVENEFESAWAITNRFSEITCSSKNRCCCCFRIGILCVFFVNVYQFLYLSFIPF